MTVATPVVVGATAQRLRRIVPIAGGTFVGPRLSGRVVPGGADWQVVRADGVLSIEATVSPDLYYFRFYELL